MSSDSGLSQQLLEQKAREYLDSLCLPYPDRHVGGPGNAAANELFVGVASQLGYEVRQSEFDCVVWEPGPTILRTGGEPVEVNTGPYSLPVATTARLAAAGSIEELEALDARGSVLLLHGELVKAQLTPTNYPFYRWDSHTRILDAINAAGPVAVIAATSQNTEMVGSQYPFPLLEDADFDIPHAYLTDVEGLRLLQAVGEPVELEIQSGRRTATARQIVASTGPLERKIVVSAHIDSRRGSPGAIDNASGVIVLLLLAELLAGLETGLGVEIVPFNGEDDYAAPGEMVYLGEHGKELAERVVLNVNVDGVGWRDHDAEVSFYECSAGVEAAARKALRDVSRVVEGGAWPQSDHMVFVMRGIAAIALTTADAAGFRAQIAHTAADVPSEVAPVVLVDVARYVANLVRVLASTPELTR